MSNRNYSIIHYRSEEGNHLRVNYVSLRRDRPDVDEEEGGYGAIQIHMDKKPHESWDVYGPFDEGDRLFFRDGLQHCKEYRTDVADLETRLASIIDVWLQDRPEGFR